MKCNEPGRFLCHHVLVTVQCWKYIYHAEKCYIVFEYVVELVFVGKDLGILLVWIWRAHKTWTVFFYYLNFSFVHTLPIYWSQRLDISILQVMCSAILVYSQAQPAATLRPINWLPCVHLFVIVGHSFSIPVLEWLYLFSHPLQILYKSSPEQECKFSFKLCP